MSSWLRVAGGTWLFLAVTACGSGSVEPRPLPLDSVNCSRCTMIVSEPTHAAQAVIPGEEPRFYDDRGCLAEHAPTLPREARLFVQADGAGGWIDVHEAFFAFPADLRTPMGHGVTAFRNQEDAVRHDRGGRTLRWADVVREVRKH